MLAACCCLKQELNCTLLHIADFAVIAINVTATGQRLWYCSLQRVRAAHTATALCTAAAACTVCLGLPTLVTSTAVQRCLRVR
jgi:hypothetical protein